jgi:hypothetical protein
MLYKSNRDSKKSVYAEQIKSVFGHPEDGWHGFLENGLKYELPKDVSPVPEPRDYLVAAHGKTAATVVKRNDFEGEYGNVGV